MEKLLIITSSLKDLSLKSQLESLLLKPRLEFALSIQDTSGVIRDLFPSRLSREDAATAVTHLDRLGTSQPLWSAPGGSFHEHHGYPGGLIDHLHATTQLGRTLIRYLRQPYGPVFEEESIVTALLLHDIAKPSVFQWTDEGSFLDDGTIAGLDLHHLFSIAELIYRNFSPPIIYLACSAHYNPVEGKDQLFSCISLAERLVRRESYFENWQPTESIIFSASIVFIADKEWMFASLSLQRMIGKIWEVLSKTKTNCSKLAFQKGCMRVLAWKNPEDLFLRLQEVGEERFEEEIVQIVG